MRKQKVMLRPIFFFSFFFPFLFPNISSAFLLFELPNIFLCLIIIHLILYRISGNIQNLPLWKIHNFCSVSCYIRTLADSSFLNAVAEFPHLRLLQFFFLFPHPIRTPYYSSLSAHNNAYST